MKINDRIILYMDGQMTDSEKEAFEEQLLKYPELLEELNSYKNMMNEIGELKDIKIDPAYFAQKIPKVRADAEKKYGHRVYPKFALAFSILIAFAFSFWFTLSLQKSNKVMMAQNSIIGDTTIVNINSSLGFYSSDYNYNDIIDNSTEYDSLISSMIADELNNNSGISYIQTSGNPDLNSMVKSINTKEADEIYKQILNKKFF